MNVNTLSARLLSVTWCRPRSDFFFRISNAYKFILNLNHAWKRSTVCLSGHPPCPQPESWQARKAHVGSGGLYEPDRPGSFCKDCRRVFRPNPGLSCSPNLIGRASIFKLIDMYYTILSLNSTLTDLCSVSTDYII